MQVINLACDSSEEIVKKLNNASRLLKVRMNLGGFAWVVDSDDVCIENGFCLMGNTPEVQRGEIKRLAYILGVTVFIH